MEADKTSYRPFEYLDRMEGNNHIVLLYDNSKYADLIIARYLFNGLKKGESCIFFTSDNPKKVRKRLTVEGINADSLRIFQIERDNKNKPEASDTRVLNIRGGNDPDGRGGILRISFDGDVIDGKGILGDDDPLNKYYAYGLRNSFGIGFDPLTGQLWDTENGQSTNDEINLVQPGFNSGWRVIQGPSSLKADFDKNDLEDFGGKGSYRDPEFDWFDTVAPTSVLFFNSDKLGDRYENDLFIGSVKNGTLYHFELAENRSQLDLNGPLADKIADNSSELKDVTFANKLGVITDLEVGPDGYLYVLSDFRRDGTIFRISPTDYMTNTTKNE